LVEETEHILVPVHELLTDAEAKKVLEELHVNKEDYLKYSRATRKPKN